MATEVFVINMEENKKEGEVKNTAPGFKKIKLTILFVIGVLVLLILSSYGYQKYDDWKFNKELKELTEEANKPYLEDVYGGKTPRETLELFIAAVEKEDFELASKYFVLDKQEEWGNGLINAKEKNNLIWLIEELRKINNSLDYVDPTAQLNGRELYTVGEKMLVTFIKYPQGIWKIQEI